MTHALTPQGPDALTAPSRVVAPPIQLSESQLADINERLANAAPNEILEWSIDNLPALFQTTAFGLTGCVTLDMVAKISKARAEAAGRAPHHLIPLIFIDTLFHFPETLELSRRAAERYSAPMHVYCPPGADNVAQFENLYGTRLWERDEDSYDYLVKVEPARRAYDELGVRAVLTGRRRSQGADRASLQAVEVDETGLVKVNPLLNWSFTEVQSYVKEHDVPYNALLDRGYKSVGDWHSTKLPMSDGDAGERSGRWAVKTGAEGGAPVKTECGLHKDYFKMKREFAKKRREAELAAKDAARDKVEEEERAQAQAQPEAVAQA